jgi:hypothetical protein
MDILKATLFAIGATVTVGLSSCGDPGGDDGAANHSADTAASVEQTAGTDVRRPAGTDGPAATPRAAQPSTAAASGAVVDSNLPGDACGATKVVAFVSQKATAEVKRKVAAEVGHSTIRWVGPDTVVTQDYSPQRLNVTLDANDVITGGKCG